MGPGRARGDRREVRAKGPERDRDLAGADVRDAHRDDERADAIRPAFGERDDVLKERGHAAEPRPEDHAGPLGELTFEPLGEPGLVHRLARRDQPELDVAFGSPKVLAVEYVAGVEVLDLTRNLRREPARIEALDAAHAAATVDEAVPRRRDVVAQRRHGTHTGDHNAAMAVVHRTSLPVRTVAARYTSPARPRSEIAFETTIVSYSVRLISAVTASPSIVTSAHDAVGSPSKL